MDKALAARIRVYADATNRKFNNACETLLYEAITAWEQSGETEG